MKLPLKNKNILIGITGGIAVYKICSLVNEFIKEGADVRVIMTDAAKKFVTPLTFQALTNHPVYSDLFEIYDQNAVEHIWLAKWPHVFVLAPATANTIAKLANGFADNMLTTVIMALPKKTKVVIAPAMNTEMWSNEIVQKNIIVLRKTDKYAFVEPRAGILACRDEGIGKVADFHDIASAVKKILHK
jgi:phosphopantothenoylcysteine decarboxylase / phosphopantothenate---cysteine ligase